MNERMKNNRMVPVLVLMPLLLICCKGTQYLMPTGNDVTIAKSHWQSATLSELKQGYDIFTNKCTDCHGIKKPQKWSEADWIKTMQIMGRKAKLDSNEYSRVLHYILAKRETVLSGKK